jgi:hypothetical protein
MKKIFALLICLTLGLTSCASHEGVVNITTAEGTSAQTVEGARPEDKVNENIEYYQNPIIKAGDKDTWADYGVGDPFVMRYNGRYYLYCSTKDGQVGIKCFTSDDLVSWSYSGLCATEALTMSAYAPEVVYYNGSFYMYTSPAGNGHYVLESESPTGPFYAVTDNIGLSIDGDVFIDDDGTWHFYSAAYDSIMAYPMSAPDVIDTEGGIKISTDLNGWTEGSMIVKHNDVYYMTYTGNHVWTAGYRINYAISTTSPTSFNAVENNPLLLSTDKKTVMGIGHSSTVIGPNLDEYYIAYHSFETVPKRNMNIDRIVFNGDGTVVLGATTDKQQAPEMPDVYCRFEDEPEHSEWSVVGGGFDEGDFVLSSGGKAISRQSLSGDYTAEFNLKSISGKAGILFGYRNDENYASAIYDSEGSMLEMTFVAYGNETKTSVPISASFSDSLRSDALILFTVRKRGDEYTIFVNNREVYKCQSLLGDGSIGVLCEDGEASLGFVGGTGASMQSSIADVYKPVESTIPAFLTVSQAETTLRGSTKYLSAVSGGKYEYKVNVSTGGDYDIIIEYRSKSPSVIEVYQNGVMLGEVTLPDSKGKLMRISGRGLVLSAGCGEIELVLREGGAELLDFSFHKAQRVIEKTYDFERSMSAVYKDGSWRLDNGGLLLDGEFGKYMIGSESFGNYIAETDITIVSDNINAGLCVRVSNPATHEANRISEGSDYLQGYFIGLVEGSVILGKHNYNWQELKRVDFDVKVGETYRLSVEVNENTIRISVDGKLVMTYKDTNAPFLHGMVGYRVHASSARFDNLSIKGIE